MPKYSKFTKNEIEKINLAKEMYGKLSVPWLMFNFNWTWKRASRFLLNESK